MREALINTLVHADYSDCASIRIQKNPHNYNFRNPGTLRIPAEQVMKVGESDCRNRILHQLFLMLGLGERAGSGLPKSSKQRYRITELGQTLINDKMRKA